jgi:signal transduction histidine kinase
MPAAMMSSHESARLLGAVHLATSKLAQNADARAVLRDILEICIEAVGAEGGTIYAHDPTTRTLKFWHVLPESVAEKIERMDIPDDYGVAGQVFQTGKTVTTENNRRSPRVRTDIERKAGVDVRNLVTVPLAIAGMPPIGVVQVVNKKNGTFNEADEAVLDIVSDVAAFALINSRLSEQQTRVASLEGMGRAAHDLANKAGVLVTFLPAIERDLTALRAALAVKPNPEAQAVLDSLQSHFDDVVSPYSDRVYRYSRLINDLAAGKTLTPKLRRASLASVVRESAEFLESDARNGRVAMVYELDTSVPEFEFDDLFVIRIVENLVGNAIKAVKERVTDEWLEQHRDDDEALGQVTVRTRYADGKHVLEVVDTGPGMSPATVRAILAGRAVSRWERNVGTGLGTKVVLDLAQALGAKVSIHSKLDEGTTFRVEFPA